MKHISLKIFILVLIAGIVGIAGVGILKSDIDLLSGNYRVIIDEHSENINTTNEIRLLLYKHQTVVTKHVMADTEQKYIEYKAQANELSSKLMDIFTDFGDKMSGGIREQLFHAAYTEFCSYIDDSKNAMQLSYDGKKGTANYYVVVVMDSQIKKVNNAFDDLDAYFRSEITEARNKMEECINASRISAMICVPVIIIAMLVTLFFCVRMTSNLDRYKTKLEHDIAAKNAALRRHNEKMLSLQNNTIIGLANLIESRDGDTGEHVKRTSLYVNMLAKEAQNQGYHADILTDEYIELLTKAAPLHDIGKIAVSDTILNKPGKLTAEEFEVMKKHAEIGGTMVREVIGGIEADDYVKIASQVASYHHEKWDGSGYCKGMSGEQIPICARIMAIADVFDALVSKRCYKKPMPVDKAFGIISESAGSHFDPTLAKIFVGLREEIEATVSF